MSEPIRIGGLELRLLRTKEDTDGSLDLFEMTVQPAGRVPGPHHHRDWDETVYGLEGQLSFQVAGESVEVAPGDHLFIPRGVVHGFENRTGGPAKVLSVLTPGVLGPGYFRELEALMAGGPPDPAALREIMLRHGLVPAA